MLFFEDNPFAPPPDNLNYVSDLNMGDIGKDVADVQNQTELEAHCLQCHQYFVVEPRSEWSTAFISWLQDVHAVDDMHEEPAAE